MLNIDTCSMAIEMKPHKLKVNDPGFLHMGARFLQITGSKRYIEIRLETRNGFNKIETNSKVSTHGLCSRCIGIPGKSCKLKEQCR